MRGGAEVAGRGVEAGYQAFTASTGQALLPTRLVVPAGSPLCTPPPPKPPPPPPPPGFPR